MELLAWGAATALLTAIVVYALTARGKQALQEEINTLRSAAAVGDARLKDLSETHAQLTETHLKLNRDYQQLSAERERIGTTLAKLQEDSKRDTDALGGSREALEEARSTHSLLDSDYRVSKAQNESLSNRLKELETAHRTATEDNRKYSDEIALLKANAAALEQQRDGLQTRLTEQKTWVEEQTRFFEERITTATSKLMEEKSRAFTAVNKKELDAVVTPFKEQLAEFRQRVDHIHSADNRDRGQLHEQILQLTNLNQMVSQRAEELTNALTITSKATGDWGEMILHKILEDSGLREGKEYQLQYSMTGSEGQTQQPDAIISLPENRQVVVDSKVSNKAWKDYCSATDDVERDERLKAHLNSIRIHVKTLAAKDYARSPDLQTVDFVLMFVPVEAALLTAFAHDDSLYTDAYRNKIILVAPSTLMAVIKLIEGMWVFQKRKESADEIAEAGRKLYEKLSTFSNSFLEVGEAIEKAHGVFNKAKGQLATGKGNAIKLAQRMVELGVGPAPGKVIATELTIGADLEDTDEAPAFRQLEGPEEEEGE